VKRLAAARGYTVIELLVVLGVLGVLAMLVMPLAEVTVQRQRETELKRALREIRDAIDAYKHAQEEGRFAVLPTPTGYPATLETLVMGMPDKLAGGQLKYFLRRVPRDPFADPALPAAKTWGLRSYESGTFQPQAGIDVYDVHSLSTGVALDGTRLTDW
jgi:general secretion pathway protein G